MVRLFLLFSLMVTPSVMGFHRLIVTVNTPIYPPLKFEIDSLGKANAIFFYQNEILPESSFAHLGDTQYIRRQRFSRRLDSTFLSKEDVLQIDKAFDALEKKAACPLKDLSLPGIYFELESLGKRKRYFLSSKKRNKHLKKALCTIFTEDQTVRGVFYSYMNDLLKMSCP
ncbi:MAG: hypothetical protein M3Y08_12530 [Fibrobacterota bacterium]|nr:hypothetical protein [Fibrobacterota bacterium]